MSQDYNATVNLPKTDFPMRASLPGREPGMVKSWYDDDVYHRMVAGNAGKPRFILHDGPPFSNGRIHMGTAMNKCLKDFIVRYKNMSGWCAPYIPGWDNHGMPIESAIIKQNKLDRKSMSVSEFRDACKEFAESFVDIQREQFKRLGILGEWDDPYLTMAPEFEADEVRVFGKMYEKGYIYKGKKPVYWCCRDETALAEAEIEYSEDKCTSIFVKFPVMDDLGRLSRYGDVQRMAFVIWTTTTWTIPGNLALCLGADFDYILAKAPDGEIYILAKELAQGVLKKAGIDSFETLAALKGAEFELMRARHPLYGRESVVLSGPHVTLEAGTGCVHTAPGHGHEDFEICRKYDRSGKTSIGIVVPVDDRGHMTGESGRYAGMYYAKANREIQSDLEAAGALLAAEEMTHQYAHCWRCKEPVLYRATDQWFCSVDAFKDEAAAACRDIQWLPEWGYERMLSMIRERADWCISRQRHWGLPIPVFYCETCHKPVCTPETIEGVAGVFEKKGSNSWFELEADAFLPGGFKCPHCGGTGFYKETCTLDGWFDSGSSHIAALQRKSSGDWPSTMYLEGADQFRGWFQSSLLTSVACRGKAPYSVCLTHGWTVDGDGKAMHKSLGNSITPDELIPKYGAELIRLWAASADYRMDMRCSDGIFKQLSETYLKIRNTARYILGNLDGFDPGGSVSFGDMLPLDRWALTRLEGLVGRCLEAYEKYEFYAVIHAIHRFCVVDMSNFYLDVLKDRLYCAGRDSAERLSGRSAMYAILDALVRLIAPILAFTSNEIWLAMPHGKGDDTGHIMLNGMPARHPERTLSREDEELWSMSLELRDDVNKVLEAARNEKLIGKPLDAKILLCVTPEGGELFGKIEKQNFAELFIVSEVEIISGGAPDGFLPTSLAGVFVKAEPSAAPKCVRCWTRSDTVGESDEHPALCARCIAAVSHA